MQLDIQHTTTADKLLTSTVQTIDANLQGRTNQLLKFLRISHDYIVESADIEAAIAAIQSATAQIVAMADEVNAVALAIAEMSIEPVQVQISSKPVVKEV